LSAMGLDFGLILAELREFRKELASLVDQ